MPLPERRWASPSKPLKQARSSNPYTLPSPPPREISEMALSDQFNLNDEVMRRIILQLRDESKITFRYDDFARARFVPNDPTQLDFIREAVEEYRRNRSAQQVRPKENPTMSQPQSTKEDPNANWPAPTGQIYTIDEMVKRIGRTRSTIVSYATLSSGRLPVRRKDGQQIFYESDAIQFFKNLEATTIPANPTPANGNAALNRIIAPVQSAQALAKEIIAQGSGQSNGSASAPVQAPTPDYLLTPALTPIPPEKQKKPWRIEIDNLLDYLEEAGFEDVPAFQREDVEFNVHLPNDQLGVHKIMVPMDALGAIWKPSITVLTVWGTNEDYKEAEPFQVVCAYGKFHHIHLNTDPSAPEEQEETNEKS